MMESVVNLPLNLSGALGQPSWIRILIPSVLIFHEHELNMDLGMDMYRDMDVTRKWPRI